MLQEIPREEIKVRGFFRVQIENPKTGKLHGDSGWRRNVVVNEGFQDYLCRLIANTTGSKQIRSVALGTGTAPNATHTTLNGEISGSTKRQTVVVSVSASKTVRFTATFNSVDSFLAVQASLRNIGLFHSSEVNATLFAGSTYASSSCDTNQNVNVTYDIQFG